MNAVVADTQSVVWFLTDTTKLSSSALAALRNTVTSGDLIFVASISLIEITYLVEKGRLSNIVLKTLRNVLSNPNSDFELISLDYDITLALERVPRGVVPDMPDRIIAATALHLQVPLVSSDAKIQALTNIKTIW